MYGRKAALVALALVTSLAPGCGTILGHAGLQDLKIHLTPDDPEAKIVVNGMPAGKGAGVYKIDSTRDGNSISVVCPDGKIGAGGVHREVMPFVVVIDIICLLVPVYIDYADGGLYSLATDININLGKPVDTTTSAPDFPNGRSNAVNNFTNNGGPPPSTQESKPCPFCGEMRPVNAANCPHCGQR
jgi:hypothetical protein